MLDSIDNQTKFYNVKWSMDALPTGTNDITSITLVCKKTGTYAKKRHPSKK